jgi:hypothetical protein
MAHCPPFPLEALLNIARRYFQGSGQAFRAHHSAGRIFSSEPLYISESISSSVSKWRLGWGEDRQVGTWREQELNTKGHHSHELRVLERKKRT